MPSEAADRSGGLVRSLGSAARPFPYRGAIYRLLGVPRTAGRSVGFPRPLPVTFRYAPAYPRETGALDSTPPGIERAEPVDAASTRGGSDAGPRTGRGTHGAEDRSEAAPSGARSAPRSSALFVPDAPRTSPGSRGSGSVPSTPPLSGAAGDAVPPASAGKAAGRGRGREAGAGDRPGGGDAEAEQRAATGGGASTDRARDGTIGPTAPAIRASGGSPRGPSASPDTPGSPITPPPRSRPDPPVRPDEGRWDRRPVDPSRQSGGAGRREGTPGVSSSAHVVDGPAVKRPAREPDRGASTALEVRRQGTTEVDQLRQAVQTLTARRREVHEAPPEPRVAEPPPAPPVRQKVVVVRTVNTRRSSAPRSLMASSRLRGRHLRPLR